MDDIDKVEEIAVAGSVDIAKKINVTQDDLKCVLDNLQAVQKKLLEQEHIIQTFASKQENFDAVNLNGIFKKNRYMQSRFFYMILCFCMSYLFTNFLYDFLTALK